MHRVAVRSATIAAVAAGALSIGCGRGDTVARVGDSTISKPVLSHWMSATVAADYRLDLGTTAPAGLVSDPANYPRCIAAATHLAAGRTPARAPAILCRELYRAVKEQAMSFLLDVSWHVEDAREHHEVVSTTEILRRLSRLKQKEMPKPGQFERYLTEVGRTKADELYLLKRNILTERQLARLRRKAAGLSGGQRAADRVLEEWLAYWTARTDCQPSYVVPQCSEYKGAAGTTPSPNHILQQLSGQTAG
jgi:hypothetical protein